nr:Smr/MutS family protein [Rhodoblastus sphagnicola]
MLSREELALWRHVVADVVPRGGRKRVTPEALLAPAPSPATPMILVAPVLPAKPSRREPPPLAPIEKKLRRRLASGREAIDDRIDLHGMTQAQAHHALIGFIHRAVAQDARIVLVITGKGGPASETSGLERGVLRRAAPLWLREPSLRALVVSVEEAARPHGGGGAFYVRLRRNRQG